MPRIVQFGIYEVALDTAELRKDGTRLRLQEQPFLVLVSLLERPGELVTRDELKERIWAKDIFVDFDQSLNKAVNRLRETLNDSAGRPLYIETVPRRGYRFIAPVTGRAPQVNEIQAPSEAGERPVSERVKSKPIWSSAIAMAIVSCGLVFAFLYFSRRTVTPRQPTRITRDGLAMSLKFSRDGKLLVYASKAGGDVTHIWVRQTAGGEPLQITSGTYDDSGPVFSPDGTHVAFRSDRGGSGYFIAPTFGGEVRLLMTKALSLQYSPDGKRILFTREAPSFAQEIFVAPIEGGVPRRLCPNWEAAWETPVFWSPNAKAILFFGNQKEEIHVPEHATWHIVSPDSGEPKQWHVPKEAENIVAWEETRDSHQWLLFMSSSADASHLYRVAVSPEGKALGKKEQLTSGPVVTLDADLSTEGNLAFTSGAVEGDIWAVQADTNHPATSSPPERVTHSDGLVNTFATISHDGRWLAYVAMKTPAARDQKIWLKDMTAGTERPLDINVKEKFRLSISPDGSRLAYGSQYNDRTATWVVPTSGGSSKKVCEDCMARGFSANGSLLLTQQGVYQGHGRAVIIDVPSGQAKEILYSKSYPLFHPFFSWDDRWVTFKILLESCRAKLMIAPVRDGVAAKESEWITLTSGRYDDDKPQFSPDGNILYFSSTRDGNLCIWAVRLDRVSKRAIGEAFEVQHFPNARSVARATHPWEQLWVAKDKIVTNLYEVHGDVWMTKID